MIASFKKSLPPMPSFNSALIPITIAFTLGAFGSVCLQSTHVYLVEQAVCRNHFLLLEPTNIGSGGLVDEEMCKIPEIQAQVARIHGIYTFLSLSPGEFRQMTTPSEKMLKFYSSTIPDWRLR